MIELPFARGEYAQRLKKIRAEMQKRDLELLIVNDVANQHYITAYDGWSFYTPQRGWRPDWPPEDGRQGERPAAVAIDLVLKGGLNGDHLRRVVELPAGP